MRGWKAAPHARTCTSDRLIDEDTHGSFVQACLLPQNSISSLQLDKPRYSNACGICYRPGVQLLCMIDLSKRFVVKALRQAWTADSVFLGHLQVHESNFPRALSEHHFLLPVDFYTELLSYDSWIATNPPIRTRSKLELQP